MRTPCQPRRDVQDFGDVDEFASARGLPGEGVLAAACSQPASSIPTRGRLVSLGGRPLHGSPIRITGCPDQVTVSDGSFDTSCATATYDLAATASNFGIAYLGLTRRDPVVTVPVVIAADGSSGITGTVGGRADGREAGVVVTTTAWAKMVTGLGDAPNDVEHRGTAFNRGRDVQERQLVRPHLGDRRLELAGRAQGGGRRELGEREGEAGGGGHVNLGVGDT